MTKLTSNRVHALWLLAAAVPAGAALASVGCSSGPPGGSGVDLPDTPAVSENQAPGTTEACKFPSQGCACEEGQATECGEVLSREGNSVTCALGTRKCDGKSWGTCSRENVVTRMLPPGGSEYSTMGYGAPAQCANNPCDPYCYNIIDNGTGLDAGTPLKIVDGGVTLDGKPKPPPKVYSGLMVTPNSNPTVIVVTGIPAGQYPVTNPSNPIPFQAQYTPVENPPAYTPAIWSLDAYDYSLINGAGKLTVVTAVPHRPLVKATASNFTATSQAEVIVDVVEAEAGIPQSIIDLLNQAPPATPGPVAVTTTMWSEPFTNNANGWTLGANPPPPPPPDMPGDEPPQVPEALLHVQTAPAIKPPDDVKAAPYPGAKTAAEPKAAAVQGPILDAAQSPPPPPPPGAAARSSSNASPILGATPRSGTPIHSATLTGPLEQNIPHFDPKKAPKTAGAGAAKYVPPEPEHLEPLPPDEPGGGTTAFDPLAAQGASQQALAPMTPLEAASTERLRPAVQHRALGGNGAQLADNIQLPSTPPELDPGSPSTIVGQHADVPLSEPPPPPPPCNGSYNAVQTFVDKLSSTTMTLAWDGSAYWSSSGGSNSGARYARYDANGNLLATYQPGLDFRSIFTKEGNGATVFARQYANPTIYQQTSQGVFGGAITLSGGSLDAQAAVVYNTGSTEFVATLGGIVYRWNTSGTYLGQVTLSGFGGVAAENNYPQNRGIAVVGGYYLTYSNQILSVWSAGGSRLSQSTLVGAGTSFDSHFSLSYANGKVWIVDVAGGTWRGYDMSACLGGGGGGGAQTCTHPLFSQPAEKTFNCPTGAKTWSYTGNLDPSSSDQAKAACEACYGVGKCYLEFADCAGGGWGPSPPGAYVCMNAYFGYQAGCSGDNGRTWPICQSWDYADYGYWGKPAAESSCSGGGGGAVGCQATGVTFTIEEANCGSGSIQLAVNGTVVKTIAPALGCSCNSQPMVVTLNDAATLALIKGSGDKFTAATVNGSNVAYGYVKVDVTYANSKPLSACLFDAVVGGNCAARDVCNGYQWDPAMAGQTGNADCAGCQSKSVTFTIEQAACGGGQFQFWINGTPVATAWPLMGCTCNATPQTVTISDAASMALVKGTGDTFGITVLGGSSMGYGYAKVDVAFANAASVSTCLYDAVGGNCAARELCNGIGWDVNPSGKTPAAQCGVAAGGTCTHLLFDGAPVNFTCPTGKTSFSYTGKLDPGSSDQAKAACEACYGVGKCFLESADCAGLGWGPSPPGQYSCGNAYFGYQNGCSGDWGRSWPICYSWAAQGYGHWGMPEANSQCSGAVPQAGTCTHPLFSAPAEKTFTCPTGAKTWSYTGNLDPASSDQAKAACEACYGAGKCYLENADCAGLGWGPSPPGQYVCMNAYFGYQAGCSGDNGRTWPICQSWDYADYGYWGKPAAESQCAAAAGGCTHPLFSNGGGYACPTGATSFSFNGNLDPASSDQAKAACEACYGAGKCYLEFADCAGGGWGPAPPGAYTCGKAYFGYQNGCSGDNGRAWYICSSFTTYGWWGKPPAAAVCNGNAEWQIGAPKPSIGQSYGNPDPANDHGGNNGIAGVVIGGNASKSVHGLAYLTSPAINTAGYTTAKLNFWRWLNSDASPYMVNTIDAYNGSTWTNIWTSGGAPGIADAAWTQQTYDVTAFKNAGFKFRFGFNVTSPAVASVSSWNIDDVTMTDTIIQPAPPADTRILYPYANTVFPRSFTPPVLQWDSPTGKNATYVKYCLRFNDANWPSQPGKQTFSWCYVETEKNPKRGSFPLRAWKLFETTASGKDAKLTLQRVYNGAQLPQVEVPIHFSSQPMRGSVYYWQINSGSVNRINQDGSLSQNFLATGGRCIACHAVSADGTTLVAQMDGGNGPGGAFNTGNGAATFWRGNTVQFQAVSPNGAWTFWGEYPLYLSPTNSGAISNSFYSPQGGRFVANPSWSPLGNYVAYASRINAGWYVDYYNADLGIIQVNPQTGALANNKIIVPAPGGARPIVTYPTFTPDDKFIVYQTANAIRTRGNYGNLWLTDINGAAPTQLKQAEGTDYLDAGNLDISYEPTFSPTASGGYYWLVFVSNRDYGNTILNAAPRKDNGIKQMWVTAIDQNPQLGKDPSHPAFWLAGQQTNNNNMRGAFAKAPCNATNAACEWNDDCCGYNAQDPANSTAKCVISQPVSLPVTRTCAQFVPGQCKADGTACAVDTDCCGYPTSSCIQGLCQVPNFVQYQQGTFVRDFDPQCPAGTHVVWTYYYWRAFTPDLSKPVADQSYITFDVQTADTIAGLTGAPHVALITAQAQNGNWSFVDVGSKIGVSKNYLRVNAVLNPSSDLTQAPILTDWTMQYDCAPTY